MCFFSRNFFYISIFPKTNSVYWNAKRSSYFCLCYNSQNMEIFQFYPVFPLFSKTKLKIWKKSCSIRMTLRLGSANGMGKWYMAITDYRLPTTRISSSSSSSVWKCETFRRVSALVIQFYRTRFQVLGIILPVLQAVNSRYFIGIRAGGCFYMCNCLQLGVLVGCNPLQSSCRHAVGVQYPAQQYDTSATPLLTWCVVTLSTVSNLENLDLRQHPQYRTPKCLPVLAVWTVPNPLKYYQYDMSNSFTPDCWEHLCRIYAWYCCACLVLSIYF